jgi:triosephosphate isomerase
LGRQRRLYGRGLSRAHAERRRLFQESDLLVAFKAKAAERSAMTPLICVCEIVRGKVEDAVKECWIQMEPVLDATSQEVI